MQLTAFLSSLTKSTNILNDVRYVHKFSSWRTLNSSFFAFPSSSSISTSSSLLIARNVLALVAEWADRVQCLNGAIVYMVKTDRYLSLVQSIDHDGVEPVKPCNFVISSCCPCVLLHAIVHCSVRQYSLIESLLLLLCSG